MATEEILIHEAQEVEDNSIEKKTTMRYDNLPTIVVSERKNKNSNNDLIKHQTEIHDDS